MSELIDDTDTVPPDSTPVARMAEDPRVRRVAWAVAGLLGYMWVIHRFFPSPSGVILQGVVIGSTTAFAAMGMALIYRSSRIINFAQGDLGGVPAAFGVLLILGPGVPFALALPVALVAAIALGAFVEFTILRRFFNAPRLILTVVTIGLSQILAGIATIMPDWFDLSTSSLSYQAPIDINFSLGTTRFDGNEVLAMLSVPIVVGLLSWFLRSTSYGIAIRASAESTDRAALLGVPVKRISTVVWVVATVLSTVGAFMRAGILALPIGAALGPSILIRALAAAVIGRMERLPTIFAASIALGVLETTVIFSDVNTTAARVDAVLFFVVLGALLLQRRGRTARGDEISAWQAAKNIRPIPRELIHLPEVRWGLRAGGAAIMAVVLGLPLVFSDARLSLAGSIAIICIVAMSLVVLTGWAGQVSLGQIAFMGIGAAVGGWLTVTWDWDLAVVIVASGVIGAVTAIAIGIPALRIRGLFLGVATLAFAIATSSYALNQSYVSWLPDGRIPRNPILGRVDISTETRYYYLCIACLLLAIAMVRGLRNSRIGRVLIAIRDNERGAQAYGINLITAKLTAFALSGFLAAAAGALFVHSQQSLGIQPYAPARSFQIFIMVVIGGLGSIPGAILGPVVIEGIEYFRSLFPEAIRNIMLFLTTGVGLIMILLFLPGGFGQVYYETRDKILRFVADRRGIHVPSLVADGNPEAETTIDADGPGGPDRDSDDDAGVEPPVPAVARP